jgi:hypothetical protein
MCELALERMPLSMYCTERRRCGKHQDWQCRSLRHLTIRFGGSPCRPGFPQTFKHVSAYFNLHSSDSTIYIYILLNAGFGIYLSFLRTFPQEKHFWNVNFSCFLQCFLFYEMVRNGIPIIFIFQGTVRNKITKFRVFFSSTKLVPTELRVFFRLLWNGSKRNSMRFPFRETDGIPKELIKISICSVFCWIFFFSENGNNPLVQADGKRCVRLDLFYSVYIHYSLINDPT